MKAKQRPHRIVYKYVEVSTSDEETTPQPPNESLAYRAWANCYQPPTVHFKSPSLGASATAPSKSSSQPSLASTPHPSTNSASSHSCTTTSPPPVTAPSLPAPKPPPPAPKTRAYSSPAVLTKRSISLPKPHASRTASPPLLARSPSRPVESSYTTTTTAITTKDGTVMTEHKFLSSTGYHDGKGAVDWSGFRSPDWAYPLHKKVKGKKVLASYPHCQAW